MAIDFEEQAQTESALTAPGPGSVRKDDGAGERRRLGVRSHPRLLTVQDVEGMTRISRKTLYRYVRQGRIPYVRIQSNIRFRLEDIEDWIEEQSYRPRSRRPPGSRASDR